MERDLKRAHERKQLSKKSRETVSSAVSSRVRVNFGEIFASRGRETYLSFLIIFASPKFTHTREETAELTASRDFLLSCFLSCAPGFSKHFLWISAQYLSLKHHFEISTSSVEIALQSFFCCLEKWTYLLTPPPSPTIRVVPDLWKWWKSKWLTPI